jgi:hypothetical protein
MPVANQRLYGLATEAAKLPEYSGWDPDSIASNISEASGSGDNGRVLRLTSALSAIPAYNGWGHDEIKVNINEILHYVQPQLVPVAPSSNNYIPKPGDIPINLNPPDLNQRPDINQGLDTSNPDWQKTMSGAGKLAMKTQANVGKFVYDVSSLVPEGSSLIYKAIGLVPGKIGEWSNQMAASAHQQADDLRATGKSVADYWTPTEEEQDAIKKGGMAAGLVVGGIQIAAILPQLVLTGGEAQASKLLETFGQKYGPTALKQLGNIIGFGEIGAVQGEAEADPGVINKVKGLVEGAVKNATAATVFGGAGKVAETLTAKTGPIATNLIKRTAQVGAGYGLSAAEGGTTTQNITSGLLGGAFPAGKKEPIQRNVYAKENGRGTQAGSAQEGAVQEANGGLRVRDNAQTGMETGAGRPNGEINQPQPTRQRVVSEDEFVGLSPEEQKKAYGEAIRQTEMNSVTDRPGFGHFKRTFSEVTNNYSTPVWTAVGDINGFKEFNDRILGIKGTDDMNAAIYDKIAASDPEINVSNIHGDEYIVTGPSKDRVQAAIKRAMNDIADNPVTGKDGKLYKPTMSWKISQSKTLEDVGNIQPKGFGKNNILDENSPGNIYTLDGGDNVLPGEIVSRKVAQDGNSIPDQGLSGKQYPDPSTTGRRSTGEIAEPVSPLDIKDTRTPQEIADDSFVKSLSPDQQSRLQDPTTDISDIDFSKAPQGFEDANTNIRELNAEALGREEKLQKKEIKKIEKDSGINAGGDNAPPQGWDNWSDKKKYDYIQNLPEETKVRLSGGKALDVNRTGENEIIKDQWDAITLKNRRGPTGPRKSNEPNLFNQQPTKFSDETGTLPGMTDTRTQAEKETVRLEAERKQTRRENPLEGTPLFDKNEQEAMATEQGDLFKAQEQILKPPVPPTNERGRGGQEGSVGGEKPFELNTDVPTNVSEEVRLNAKKQDDIFKKNKEGIKASLRKDKMSFWDNVMHKWVDVSYGIKKKLVESKLGRDAAMRLNMINRSRGIGKLLSTEAMARITRLLPKNLDEKLGEYSYNKRAVELGKREGATIANPYGGTAKTSSDWLEFLKKANPEVEKKLDAANTQMRKEFQEQVLQPLVGSGLLSKEAMADIIKNNEYYFPRKFIQHIDPSSKGVGSKGEPIDIHGSGIKAIKEGSEEAMVLNPTYLLEEGIMRTQTRIVQNNANKALYEYIKDNPENAIGGKIVEEVLPTEIDLLSKADNLGGEKVKLQEDLKTPLDDIQRRDIEEKISKVDEKLDKISETIKKVKDRGELKKNQTLEPEPIGYRSLSAWFDGVEHKMIIPRETARFWVTSDPVQNQSFGSFLRWISGTAMVKPLATGINPEFATGNPFRDSIHYWIAAGKQYNTLAPVAIAQMANDIRQITKDVVLRNGVLREYILAGGTTDTITREGLSNRSKPYEMPSQTDRQIEAAKGILEYPGQTSELIMRLALYNRAKKNGHTNEEAAYIASNVLDFAQGGSYSKGFDNFSPYFGASIQGTRGIVRAFRDDPIRAGAKVAQLMAFSYGLAYWNSKKNKEAWDSISQKEKETKFIITTPFSYKDANGIKRWMYVGIPKDQAQRGFTSVAEAAADKMNGNIDGSEALKRVGLAFANNLPADLSAMPPTLSAFVGYVNNKDFWNREDMWTGPEVSPANEYWKTTPEFLKGIGKASKVASEKTGGLIPEISPVRLQKAAGKVLPNNFFSGILGGAYNEVISQMKPEEKEKLEKTIIEKLTSYPMSRKLLRVSSPPTSRGTPEELAAKKVILKSNRASIDLGDRAREYVATIKEQPRIPRMAFKSFAESEKQLAKSKGERVNRAASYKAYEKAYAAKFLESDELAVYKARSILARKAAAEALADRLGLEGEEKKAKIKELIHKYSLLKK